MRLRLRALSNAEAQIGTDALPRWFRAPLTALVIAISTFVVVGGAAAMLGVFHPALVVPVTVVLTGAGVYGSRCARRVIPAQRSTHTWTALVVLGAVIVAGWNTMNKAEHLIIERDPAVYVATARWLTDHDSLWIDGPDPLFEDSSDMSFRTESPGFSQQENGSVAAQFPHGVAVVAAGAGWLDDGLILAVNAAMASVALLCLFAAASTLMRPMWAAAATGAWSAAFPFLYFARDLYSEPLSSVLLFGGLWMMMALRPRRVVSGIVVGAVIGSLAMVRIDSYVAFIPIVLVFGMYARHSWAAGDRRSFEWSVAAIASGAIVAVLGFVDTSVFSPSYYASDLAPRITVMVAANVAALVLGFVAVPWAYDIAERRWSARPFVVPVVGLACGAVAAIVAWAATIRPSTAGLPEFASDSPVPVLDLLDRAGSMSYRWLEWYLGRPLVALGFLGLIGLTALGVSRGRSALALALPGVVLATTLLYLLAPNITPDQPWAMRRFAAVTLPGLLLAAAWVFSHVWSWAQERSAVGGIVVVAVFLACLVPLVQATRPLRNVSVGGDTMAVVDSLCDVVTEEPSAVLISPAALLSLTLPQTVQMWCGMPVAGARDELEVEDVIDLASAWEARGRRLVLVGADETQWDVPSGPSIDLGTIVPASPESTITRRPERLAPDDQIAKTSDRQISLHATVVSTP